MKLVLALVLLMVGCADSCGRHAQWLSYAECEVFCEDYGGIDNYDKGLCECVSTYNQKAYAEQKKQEALQELGISEEQLQTLQEH